MLPIVPSPLQFLENELFNAQNIKFYIKRDDLIHTEISGNKWRKLIFNIDLAITLGKPLLTFGGTFSNHIYAVAAAGKIFNLKTIGIIRGEKPNSFNSTLTFASSQGMDLHFVSRSQYQNKDALLEYFKNKIGDFYYIPEGGANDLGIKGCESIVHEINQQLDTKPHFFCVPCGTGTTFSGVLRALDSTQKCLGFSALKIETWENDLKKLTNTEGVLKERNWDMISDYHFGGYAKWQPELINFINNFKTAYNIELDPIYTGKMFYGIFDLAKKGYFEPNSTIVAVHTGGLQGIKGFNDIKLRGRDIKIN